METKKPASVWHQDKSIYTSFLSEGRIFVWHHESSKSRDGIPEFDIEYMHEPGTKTLWRRWRLSPENEWLPDPEPVTAEFSRAMSQRKSTVSLRVDQAIRNHITRTQER